MKIVIVGAGGIGAYYGARLINAGHDVVFVARGPHLEAMQRSGLRVVHPDFQFQEAVKACPADHLPQICPANEIDLVVITLKAMQTSVVMQSLNDWLSQSGVPVLSLQNGVDNEAVIARFVGEGRTIGGLAVRIGGHIIEPGYIEATGVAQIVMGSWPDAGTQPVADLPAIAEAFNEAGIPTRVTGDIRKELWTKLLINNGVNPLSALTELDTKALTAHPVYGETVYGLMKETAVAATADGVHLATEEIDAMYDLICSFDAIKTSMLVDLEKGRTLEIDEICGAVKERCRRLGVESPLTSLIEALLLQKLERR